MLGIVESTPSPLPLNLYDDAAAGGLGDVVVSLKENCRFNLAAPPPLSPLSGGNGGETEEEGNPKGGTEVTEPLTPLGPNCSAAAEARGPAE